MSNGGPSNSDDAAFLIDMAVDVRVTTGSTKRNMRKVLLASGATAGFSTILQLFLTPYIVHRVGLEAYGTLVVLLSLISFGGLLDFGVRTELTRRVALASGDDDWAAMSLATNEGTGVLAGASLVLLLLFAILGPFLTRSAVPHSSVSHVYLLLLCLVAMVAGGWLLDSRGALLSGLQRGDVGQRIGIVTGILRVILTIPFLLLSSSIWSLFFAQAASSLASWIWVMLRVPRVAPRINLHMIFPRIAIVRGFLVGGFMLVLSQVSDLVDYNVDRLIIGHFIGITAAAQYTLGTQLPITLRGLCLIPTGVLLTAVAEMHGRRKHDLDRTLEAVTKLTLSAGLIVFCGVLTLAPAFYKLYLGQGYSLTIRAAQLLAVATLINLLSAPWSLYALGRGWYSATAWAAGANVLVNGTVSFVLTITIGYTGALSGSIAGNSVGLIVLYLVIRNKERRPWLRLVTVCIGFAVVLGSVSWFLSKQLLNLSWLEFLIAGLLLVLAVLALLSAGGLFRFSEMQSVLSRSISK